MADKEKLKVPQVVVSDENETEFETTKKWLKKEFKLNKEMVPIKAALFMYVGGVTSFLPYLTLHMKEIGLTMEEIAIIYAVLPVASLVGPTASGILADKFSCYTAVLNTNVFLTALLHTLLLVVPQTSPNSLLLGCDDHVYSLQWQKCREGFSPVNDSYALKLENCILVCPDSPATFTICLSNEDSNTTSCFDNHLSNHSVVLNGYLSNINYSDCSHSLGGIGFEEEMYDSISCPNPCPLMCPVSSDNEDGDPIGTRESSKVTFYVYFVLRVLATMAMASCWSMMDAVVLAKVKETGGDFGRQRIMTMASQALLPLLAGILVDFVNEGSNSVDYSAAFYLGDVLLSATILVMCSLKLQVDSPDQSVGKNIIKLVARVDIDIFLMIITFLGMNWGFLETYLFLYLKELKAPTFLLGLTLTVGCASGLPVMFWSDHIVEKLGRHTVFLASFLAYFVRFVGYSYIWNPWYCFPFEVLEVITYQIMWVAAATYCPILAPPGLLATMTGIAGSAHYSLGRGLGSFLGGYVISSYGLRETFRGFGYAALGGGVLYLVVYKLVLQRSIQVREKALKLAEMQGLGYKNDQQSIEIVAMMQNSSRRSSFAM